MDSEKALLSAVKLGYLYMSLVKDIFIELDVSEEKLSILDKQITMVNNLIVSAEQKEENPKHNNDCQCFACLIK